MPDFHVTFRNLSHAVNLRHETDGFTSPPKEGVLRIFFAMKNPKASVGFEPANLGTKGQQATSRPPKPLSICLSRIFFSLISIAQSLLSFPFLRFAFYLSLCYILLRSLLLNFTFRNPVLTIILSALFSLSLPLSLSLSPCLRLSIYVVTSRKASHRGVPGSFPGRNVCHLWCRVWLWDRLYTPNTSSSPVSYLSTQAHVHSGKEQWACSRPQFRKR